MVAPCCGGRSHAGFYSGETQEARASDWLGKAYSHLLRQYAAPTDVVRHHGEADDQEVERVYVSRQDMLLVFEILRHSLCLA
jgi:hypothetical protein